jgi:hypothetical protein
MTHDRVERAKARRLATLDSQLQTGLLSAYEYETRCADTHAWARSQHDQRLGKDTLAYYGRMAQRMAK